MNPALIAIVAFVSFVSFFIYLTFLSAKKANEKLTADLKSLGFNPCLDKTTKDHVAKYLLIANTRHRGNRLLMNLYQKSTSQDYDLFFCDYRFASGSGRARGVEALLVCMVSKKLNVPRLTIDSVPQGPEFLTKLFDTLSAGFDFPDVKKIDASVLGLSDKFRVYVDPAQTSQIASIKDAFASVFSSKPGVCLDAKGGVLIFSDVNIAADKVSNKPLDLLKVSRLISAAQSLHDHLK